MKGISPLVSAVLLIAVTMTIAGMLAYWASSFVREQTEAFENQTVTGECSFANFEIHTCRYDVNNSKINLILANIGSAELKELSAFLIYSNNTIANFTINETLPTNTLKLFSLSPVSSDYSEITIRTHCPQLSISSGCR